MKHFLRAAAALATAFATLLAPAASAQTYEMRQRAQGLVVSSSGVASLSSQSLAFSGAAGDWTEPRVVSLTNTGQGNLGISGWGIPQGNGYNGFYVSDNTCPDELSSGQICTVTVYAQIQPGARTASLELSVTNSTTRMFRLQLASSENTPAVEPSVTLSTSAVSFGNVPTHTTVTRQVVATNTGEGVLTWGAAPAVTGDSTFSPGLTSCGSTLAAGDSCQAEVSFTPTSTGSFNGMLTFTSTLANSPHQVSLEGTAFNPVSLAAATLPAAKLGIAYTYDFKSLLSVSNEASPNKALASWSGSGTLPAGLSLNPSTGVLSGTPTVLSSATSFTVIGTYKNNQGQQVYTLRVGEAVLDVVQISAGSAHTCAVTTDGAAKCWGYNLDGQLGDGTNTNTNATPVSVVGLSSGVKSISAGYLHTCALTQAGEVKCWGSNAYGQLGDASTMSRASPVAVKGLGTEVSALQLGLYHSCVVTTAGGVKCWGYNASAQLGDGTGTDRYTPVDVQGLGASVASVAPGGYHTCAVTTGGAAKCWGRNSARQLGDGTTTVRVTPVDVQGLGTSVLSLTAGNGHTCAVTSAGGVKCWGDNASGQLGSGNFNATTAVVDVQGLSTGVASLDAGDTHTCAVLLDGGLKCWGANTYGQLGDNTTAYRATPVSVQGLGAGVTQVSAGAGHVCAATATGVAKCWGYNANGRLGDATTTNRLQPVNVLP